MFKKAKNGKTNTKNNFKGGYDGISFTFLYNINNYNNFLLFNNTINIKNRSKKL